MSSLRIVHALPFFDPATRFGGPIAQLRRDYEARLASQRAGFQTEMARRIRSRLMRIALKTPGGGGTREPP